MKVVILPLYGIGDTLMTTPAIKILKNSIKCEITNICMFQSNYEVLKGNPFIDDLIYFPFLKKSKLEVVKFINSLRGRFEASINFYPSNRWQYNLIAWFIGSKNRIGHRYIKMDLRQLNFLKNYTVKEDENLHNVEENVKLLKFFGVNSIDIPPMLFYHDDREIEFGREFVKKSSMREVKLGVHTGTSSFKNHKNKRWSKENFSELINSFPDIDFFVFGTKEEEESNQFILNNARYKNVILIQDRALRQVASIIKQMNAFISNDSGLMHLAAAVGTPVVAIFGPTNPVWVRPWGVKHRVVRAGLSCSPCFYYSPKALECVEGLDFKCLEDIDVSMVKSAIERLII